MSHGDGVPSQTKDAVKLAQSVAQAQAGCLVNLRKGVVRELQITDGDGVRREHARDWSGAILNGESGAIRLVARGLRVVVDVVGGQERASVGHPQVGRTGVKHNHLFLSRRADLDLAVVLGVHVVVNDHGVFALGSQTRLPLLDTHVHRVNGLLERQLALLERNMDDCRDSSRRCGSNKSPNNRHQVVRWKTVHAKDVAL
mmetsp:Transcript_34261/g.63898  ORF Transcript_34261/g.63898 Transcript_34261/m.63898 type:complete len:200 (+) Transcript_34261:963-1562(+)